jgi:hypothetical protein
VISTDAVDSRWTTPRALGTGMNELGTAGGQRMRPPPTRTEDGSVTPRPPTGFGRADLHKRASSTASTPPKKKMNYYLMMMSPEYVHPLPTDGPTDPEENRPPKFVVPHPGRRTARRL